MQLRRHASRRMLVLLAAGAALGGAAYAEAAGSGGSPLPSAGKLSHASVVAAVHANLPHDAAAKAAYIRANPTPPGLSHAAPATPESGILDMAQAPFPHGAVAIQNRWQELRGATLVQVYAGADAADPTQGVVVLNLVAWPSDRDLVTQTLPTPAKEGALRVTGAAGDDVTLTAENGQRFTFNVDSHALTRGG